MASNLTFATSSSWKYRQGQAYLKQYDITVEQADLELPESRSEDVLEIAKEKAAYAYNQLKQPVIVIDGAFHVAALNGFPKTFVKFAEKYVGASGVLKLMEGKKDRSYEWSNVLCYRDARVEKCFVGYIRGVIIDKLDGDAPANDFGLIQLPDSYDKTFSNMTRDELHHFEEHTWSPTLFKEFADWYGDHGEGTR
jgi:non-canonical purine NTP pyrophosphatase (RdgB/HAM1 family)